eukprot:7387532-Prymnesium_polylepis.1
MGRVRASGRASAADRRVRAIEPVDAHELEDRRLDRREDGRAEPARAKPHLRAVERNRGADLVGGVVDRRAGRGGARALLLVLVLGRRRERRRARLERREERLVHLRLVGARRPSLAQLAHHENEHLLRGGLAGVGGFLRGVGVPGEPVSESRSRAVGHRREGFGAAG